MSISVITTVDFRDAFKGLDAMGKRDVVLPAMRALKAPLRLDQREHAKAKSGPDGGWAPRAASTLARHKYKPKLPSRQLGRLPTAVSYLANVHGVSGESRIPWSAVQQDGGTVGHGARLPARPFLWISEKLMAIAVDEVSKAAVTAFGGGR